MTKENKHCKECNTKLGPFIDYSGEAFCSQECIDHYVNGYKENAR